MKFVIESLLFCFFIVICDARHKQREHYCTATGLSIITPGLLWNYRDQERWGALFPACISINQSPINLREAPLIFNTSSSCLKWDNYHSGHGPIYLTNSGYSIQATSKNWASIPILSGGPLKSFYKIDHLHFHWGATNTWGAEHILHNYTPMELHIVHYNHIFKNVNEAILSGQAEALAVVAVQFRFSPNEQANEGIATIARAINEATGEGPAIRYNLPLGHLGLGFEDEFYTYVGSLTNPPCSPIVRWIVNYKTLPIGEEELRPFRNVQVNCLPLSDNFRDVQSVNDGRRVHFHLSCRG